MHLSDHSGSASQQNASAHESMRLPAQVAIFGSGAGSNARAIITWSQEGSNASPYSVRLIVSTSANAGIAGLAAEYGLPLLVLDKTLPVEEQTRLIIQAFTAYRVDVVALAGYLRRIEPDIIQAVHGHMLNIHPSLLPKYGGKGMYGDAVHRAVLANGETESGATVHMVTLEYDEGRILAQERVSIETNDKPEDLARRVRNVEHQIYPRTLAWYVRNVAHP